MPATPKPIVYEITDLKNPNYISQQNNGCEAVLNNLAAIVAEISSNYPGIEKGEVNTHEIKKYIINILPQLIPLKCTEYLTKYFIKGTYAKTNDGLGLYFNTNIIRYGFTIRNDGKLENFYVIPPASL